MVPLSALPQLLRTLAQGNIQDNLVFSQRPGEATGSLLLSFFLGINGNARTPRPLLSRTWGVRFT